MLVLAKIISDIDRCVPGSSGAEARHWGACMSVGRSTAGSECSPWGNVRYQLDGHVGACGGRQLLASIVTGSAGTG